MVARCGPVHESDDAADIIHAVVSPEVYRLLVLDRGWRPERYVRWLTTILIEQLLSPTVASPTRAELGATPARERSDVER